MSLYKKAKIAYKGIELSDSTLNKLSKTKIKNIPKKEADMKRYLRQVFKIGTGKRMENPKNKNSADMLNDISAERKMMGKKFMAKLQSNKKKLKQAGLGGSDTISQTLSQYKSYNNKIPEIKKVIQEGEIERNQDIYSGNVHCVIKFEHSGINEAMQIYMGNAKYIRYYDFTYQHHTIEYIIYDLLDKIYKYHDWFFNDVSSVSTGNFNIVMNMGRYKTEPIYIHYGGSWFPEIETNPIILRNNGTTIKAFVSPSFAKMPLRSIKYNKVCYNIEANNAVYEYNCVSEYLLNYFKDSSNTHLVSVTKKIEGVKEWTVETLLNFCKKEKLSYKFYDFNLRTYAASDKSTNKIKIIRAMLHNEHIYPLTKEEITLLHKRYSREFDINNIVVDGKIDKNAKSLITKNPLKHVNISTDEDSNIFISSCVIGDTLYTNNSDYKDMLKLIQTLNPSKIPISKTAKIYDIMLFIAEKAELGSSYHDFITENPSPYNYNYDAEDNENLITIDKVKCYASILNRLDYLPVFDSSCNMTEYDGVFDNHNIYFIQNIIKDYDTYGIIKSGKKYSGYRIPEYLRKYLVIGYQIKPILKKNPFKGMIKPMIELNEKLTKDIICKFIGVCQSTYNNDVEMQTYKPFVVCKAEKEILKENQYIIELSNGMSIIKESYEQKKAFRKSFIGISQYVIDAALSMVLEMAVKIVQIDPNCEIISIHTDSITIKPFNKKAILKAIPDEKHNINGWKYETPKDKYKAAPNAYTGYNKFEDTRTILIPIDIPNLDNVDYSKDTIYVNCFAGCGKTYHIIEEILKKNTIKNYLVISASHKALEQYYQGGYNAKTIQSFTNAQEGSTNRLDKYDTIIIDESGLLSVQHWNYIYENLHKKTNILSFGDERQLLPVDNEHVGIMPFSSELVKTIIFGKGYSCTMEFNYRNTYKIQNYIDMYALKHKLRTWEERMFGDQETYQGISKDLNICYFNKTCDKINLKLTKFWKDNYNGVITYEKDGKTVTMKNGLRLKVGGKLTCISNYLTANKIYNNFTFYIVKYDKDEITLKHENNDNIVTIPTSNINTINFDYGYAITIYRAQGSSIDIDKVKFWDKNQMLSDGRILMTLFSRLKFNDDDIKRLTYL